MSAPLRFAQIYLAENKPAIIAAMYFNSAGIYYEQDDPILDESGDWDALGASLRAALARFSFREENLREHKTADWPSYRASHCRSVRLFEESYLRIGVRSFNEAELVYDASCRPHRESEISLHVTLNRLGKDDEIVRMVKRLFNESLRWSSNCNPSE